MESEHNIIERLEVECGIELPEIDGDPTGMLHSPGGPLDSRLNDCYEAGGTESLQGRALRLVHFGQLAGKDLAHAKKVAGL